MQLLRNNRGFSIVQVMVAIGLSGVLSLVIMKISQNMNTVQGEAEGAQEETEFKTELRMILDNSNHCTVSLAGLDPVNAPVIFKKSLIDEPNNNEGMRVELFQKPAIGSGRIKRFTDDPNDPSTTLIKYRKIKIKSMKLVMPNPPLNTNYAQATKATDIGRLIIQVEKGKKTKKYSLPLVVTMKTDNAGNSTILECRSQPQTDPCPALGMIMDQNTSTCRPKKVIQAGYARSSSYAGIWGGWGGWDLCSNNGLVCGIQTRVESSQGGGDDTALNAVRFVCCHNLPVGRLNEQEIFSSQGGWGNWGSTQYCPLDSYARAIQMKFESGQGGGDDTATNGVRLRCSDPNNTVISSSVGGWGNWDNWGACPTDQYICGLKTRVEGGQGSGDDTSFNGIETRCCKYIE